MTNRTVDCVIVGHNDADINDSALRAKPVGATSGAYNEIKTNSVLFRGKRVTAMEVLNELTYQATGRNLGLNVFEDPQAGVYYLASFLKQRGSAVEIVNSYATERERLEELLLDSPKAVAITTTYYVENDPLQEVIDFVRQRSPSTRIVVGGPHIFNLCEDLPPASRNYVFTKLGADIYIHDSQGEATLAAVMAALRDSSKPDLGSIPNLVFKDGSEFRQTDRQVEKNSLDANFVDWASLLDPRTAATSAVSLRTARSCPFACSFCNYPTMAGKHVVSEVDIVEAELRQLHELGVRHLRFIDDTFNVPLPRFKNIMRMMIRNKFEFRWVSFLRCSNADDEAFELMRQAGCVGVLLGIESGDPTILGNMNKAAKPERYEYGIRRLNEAGILSCASMIVGFPGESTQTVRNTIEFLQRSKPTFVGPLLYFHDRRAPIHLRRLEFGIKGAGYSWSHRSMNWKEAAEWVQTIYREVTDSAPLPLQSFGLFSQPHLLARGLSNQDFVDFCHALRPMLLKGLDEQSTEPGDEVFQQAIQAMRMRTPAPAPVLGQAAPAASAAKVSLPLLN